MDDYIFAAGFGLLPFVWAINVVWFFNDAFRKPEFDEQTQIKKCNNQIIDCFQSFYRYAFF